MSWFNIKNLKKTSIYVTPNFPTLQTKRYKIKFFSIVSWLAIYTVVLTFLISILLSFTPAKGLLFLVENEKLKEYSGKIEQLENQVVMLTEELDQMAVINKRLKFAIILASTDSLDSTAAIYDSLRSYEPAKRGFEGSLYNVFRDFISKYFKEEKNDSEVVFLKPVTGIIGKEFQPEKGHNGIDYAVKEGTPVVASGSGIVLFADYTFKYGYTIILQHENGYTTHYKHCSSLLKTERDVVKSGEVIALSGNTGKRTTGPHLHFEIWKNNKPINPSLLVIN